MGARHRTSSISRVTIEVNWKRIRATHRELGGDGRLILEFTSAVPVPTTLLDEAIVDEPFPLGQGPTNGGWLSTPSVAYLLLEADGYGGVEEWIQRLVDNLTAAGVSGVLTGARGSGRVPWAIGIEDHPFKFSASMCHQPLPVDGRPRLSWGAAPELKSAVVKHALDWALEGADPVKVWNRVSLRVDPAAAAAMTEFAMDAGSVVGVSGYNKSRQRVRRMNFFIPAVIELSEPCLDPLSWHEVVDGLRSEILTAPRDNLMLSQISPHGWGTRTAASGNGYIHDRHTMQRSPDVYAEWIPDPCGIQILTQAHLAKASDLSGWSLTKLDPNHWLVEANDLAAWYATPIGPFDQHRPDLVEKARTDFGDMILTRERALALGIRKPTDP